MIERLRTGGSLSFIAAALSLALLIVYCFKQGPDGFRFQQLASLFFNSHTEIDTSQFCRLPTPRPEPAANSASSGNTHPPPPVCDCPVCQNGCSGLTGNNTRALGKLEKPKFVVLLTTGVRRSTSKAGEEVTRLYYKQIRRWLGETRLHIFVVETSGYRFPELQSPRLTVLPFVSKHGPSVSSTILEAQSLIHASREMASHPAYEAATHVFKVTGRYFLSGVEKELDNADLGMDAYVQYYRDVDRQVQGSEYFAVRKCLLPVLGRHALASGVYMEHALYNVTEIMDWWTPLGKGKGFNNTVARGGDGLIVNPLRR